MPLDTKQFELDCEQYRKSNGRRALQTVMSSGKTFVVKHDHPEKVVLLGVTDHEEQEVAPADFEQDFLWYLLDEQVLYAGSQEQQESALATMKAEFEAMRICVYGKAVLPSTL